MGTTIKERPILFSGPMVRPLLNGRKTQTRRIVKGEDAEDFSKATPHEIAAYVNVAGSPYGQPGDRLWVRETWAPHFIWAGCKAAEILFDGSECIFYRADNAIRGGCVASQRESKWRPSIHMPRAASRLLLEITAVRVERVQDISEADAVAEGYSGFNDFYGLLHADDKEACDLMDEDVDDYAKRKGISYPRDWYKMLWASINGPESWAANPWVWVVEFKAIRPAAPATPEKEATA